MDTILKWLFIVAGTLLLLYKYGTRKYGYWKKKGVKQLSPKPFWGDNFLMIFRLQDALEVCNSFYQSFKGLRFGGVYMNQVPFLSVTDPELLKQILVKDGEYFINHYDWFGNIDPLFSRGVFFLRDEEWRNMRNVMTTVFTSSKMKDMFGFMDKCGKQAVEYLQEKVLEHNKSDPTGKSGYEIECRDFFSRYGTDVIGSTAFGIEVDSFRNPENEFYTSGFAIRSLFVGFQMIKFSFMITFPNLSKALGLTFLGDKYTKFFVSLIEDTIRQREEKNIVRKDVIHILMEARKGKGVDENGEPIKGKLPDLKDIDIAAQALGFFFGGFETMATLLGFITYELAVNPDVQEKLQEEIDDVIERENGVTYDGVVHQMQYLNMVINEALRKWPPVVSTDRVATKPYRIPKTDTSPEVILNKGDGVMIVTAGFHYDPEYFPNPQKFDPERFRNEKTSIKPFTFMPFGEGVRHCIGMRYALMEIKTILVHTLRKFTFVPSKKTLIPMKISRKRPMTLEPENGGFWLGLKPRN